MLTPDNISPLMNGMYLQKFFDFALDIFLMVDADGIIRIVNPQFCHLLGYTEQELLAEPLAAFLHPDDKHSTASEMKRLLEGGSTLDLRNRCRHKAGHYLSITWTAQAQEGFIYGIGRDSTALVQQHKQQFEILNQGHIEKTRLHDQHIESLNLAHVQKTRIHDQHVESLNLAHVQKTRLHDQHVESLNQEQEQGNILHLRQVEILNEENVHRNSLHDEQVKILKEQHQEESLVKDVYAQRQAAFTAELSHELRNPLNAIRGGMDVLNDELSILQPFLPENERANETFSRLKDTVHNLRICTEQQKFILDSFLDFSKLEAGKLVLSKNVFDAAEVCQDAVNMMQYIAQQKKLDITVNIPETLCLVKGDAFRLKQIILNLLGNAIKFTQEGSISFRFIEEQHTLTHTYLKIIVSDSGIGMDAHEQKRLFKSYSQANTSIAQQYGGTGLGLFITRSLVEMMKGHIEVESEKGKGSEFACNIRCRRVTEEEKYYYLEQKSTSSYSPSATQRSPASLMVLIVDDNIINQKVLGRILENRQHICHFADNGLAALKRVFPTDQYSNNLFDVIFMDTKMPVMDGLVATRAIRKLEKEHQLTPVPIIGISGGSQALDKELALKAGMNDYLVKPIQKEDAYRLIERHTTKVKQPYMEHRDSTSNQVVLEELPINRQFQL
jgi:PAS domain S-box-containing protein